MKAFMQEVALGLLLAHFIIAIINGLAFILAFFDTHETLTDWLAQFKEDVSQPITREFMTTLLVFMFMPTLNGVLLPKSLDKIKSFIKNRR